MASRPTVFQFFGMTDRESHQAEPYQLHSIPPNWEATLSQGAQNSVRSPLITPEKAAIPKLKHEALEISKVRGPFARKALMHYSYFRPLWKQGIYTL